MKEIILTINDKQVKGKDGDSVLRVCQASGIDLPTLCHLEGLSDVGACRLCVVEIEKERRPVPACTYPARDGLVVKTNTPKLENYRRLILELIFTERNHFCMFCEQSGECELQKLAYRYQMDHVRYPYNFPSMQLDTLNDYLVIDHNRCTLCGRCVRTCGEVVGVHALDFGRRGWKTVIAADLAQPLGESSCTSCGACMQACPTGAIFSKLSMYKGKAEECQQTTTVCPLCSVGCELNVLVKNNNIVRIETPELNQARGVLCKEGRFELLAPKNSRVASPMIRNEQGLLEECTIDVAIDAIARKAKELKGRFGGLASTRIPDETLSLFSRLMHEVISTEYVDTLDGTSYRVITEGIKQFSNWAKGLNIECAVEEILEANCILLVGADPLKTHPVIGSLVRRAINQGAKVIVADSARDAFPLWSSLWLKPKEGTEEILLNGLSQIIIDKGLAKAEKVTSEFIQSPTYKIDEISKATGIDIADLESAATMFGNAERGVIIYGEGLLAKNEPTLVASLLRLAQLTGNGAEGHLRVISLKPSANSRGAWELGLAKKGIRQNKLKGLYLLLSDEQQWGELPGWLKEIDFLAVQASYHSPATSMANVVLPSPVWSERDGRYVSLDGHVANSKQVIKLKDGLLQDGEILARLSRKLGHKLTPR